MIVADISSPNENVFYELGIAHTLGKKTIILTQNIGRVPFDLRTQRIVVYSDDHPGYSRLKEELPKHIRAVLAESVDEIQHVRSTVGGYVVRHTKQSIELFGDELQHARIIDSMDIVGVRDNIPVLSKHVDNDGRYSDIQCSHRFLYSDKYPGQLRITVMFEEPYIHTGTSATVEIRYVLEDAFKDDKKRWAYDASVDCSELTFQLTAPNTYSGTAQIVKVLKPIDYVLQSIVPTHGNGTLTFAGSVKELDLGATYAIKWT